MSKRMIATPSYYSEGNVPVFEPNIEEFTSFTKYIQAILPYGLKAGIAKVIPPKEWNGKQIDIQSKLNNMVIKNPEEQNFFGNGGIYRQEHYLRRKLYTVEQFERLCYCKEYCPPKPNSGAKNRTALPTKKINRTNKSKDDKSAKEFIPVTPPTNSSKESSPNKYDTSLSSDVVQFPSPPPNVKVEAEVNHRKKKKQNTEDIIVPEYDASIYTAEFLKDTERNYWRNVAFSTPLYGADLSGSLFTDDVKSWNVSNLGDILQNINVRLPGVTEPYLYFGMWRATFSWHVEDMDLFSINYIHHGAPKQWYSIPQEHRARFETFMQSIFSQDYEKCSQFMRHKKYVVSPSVLAKNCIPVNKIVHFQGEFMLTFPKGYHSGYNLGFNVAESVNFATEEWIEMGNNAKACQCIHDSVSIDMSIFNQLDSKVKGVKGRKGSVTSIPVNLKQPNSKSQSKVNKVKGSKKDLSANSKKNTKVGDKRKETESETVKNGTTKRSRPPYIINTEVKIACSLCRNVEGALIHSKDNLLYAHPICAQFIEGTEIVNDFDGKQYILGKPINNQPARTKCYKCHRMGGHFVQCSQKQCIRKFHVTCVDKQKLVFDYNSKKKSAYCTSHGPKVKPPVIEAPWTWPKNQNDDVDKFEANLKVASALDAQEVDIVVD